MMRAPVLFVSHGSPMFALEPGELGPRLESLGESLRGQLSALLIVSAHWQTRGVRVMSALKPATVHDFGGFPPALYELKYPARGEPQLAEKARELLAAAGFQAALDSAQGLDHGAWVPLRYLSPSGAIPVLQVSLPADADARSAQRLGHALAPLRESGVMIIGSGSLTHNLRDLSRGAADAGYAPAFAGFVREALLGQTPQSLLDYRQQVPHAQRAHPSEEHFLPLLVALGASRDDDVVQVLEGGMTHRVLSMDSFLWRAPA